MFPLEPYVFRNSFGKNLFVFHEIVWFHHDLLFVRYNGGSFFLSSTCNIFELCNSYVVDATQAVKLISSVCANAEA